MTSPRRRSAVFVLIVVAAFAVLVAAMWFGGGWPREEIPGLPSPGSLTTLGLPLVRVVHDICAIATVGLLVAAVALTADEASRQRLIRSAGRWSLAWAASAVLTQILTLSDLLGLPVGEALRSGFLLTFSMEVPQGQAFLLVMMLAVVIAVASTLPAGPWGRALLLAMAIFAVLPPAYVGHSASAADHNIAVSSLMLHIAGVTVWVGGLFGLVTHLRATDALVAAVRRFSALALCCFVAVGVSGVVNAWIRLGAPAQVWQSRYGLLVLGKLAALVVLGWFGWRHRRTTIAALEAGTASRPFLRLATGEIGVMACTVGLAVALSRTPPPRESAVHDAHELLGYTLPAFNPWRLVVEMRPDPLVILAVAGLGAAYLIGVRRLARSGEAWPVWRTVSAVAGLLVLLYAFAGGVSAYGPAVFSMHALQYAMLGTLGPALFALGAPLAPLREAMPDLRRGAAGPVALKLTNPLVALALYAVPYLLLYVTGLFEPAQSSLAVRLIAEIVVVVTGMWFFSVVLGLDPLPRAISPVVRTRMLLGALAVQAWVALVFLAGPLQGQGWYDVLALPWAPDRVADQRSGAVLGVGLSAVTILALLAVMTVWRRSARRRVTSKDVTAEASAAQP
ncbi:bifunctional copper resistance protein CopD/cytochrome c oxidase assembly protein [Sphaerisporangium corydalis]|uniref:Bifunctional copper resistance protein CopD/cytochrome c oxidase assembly protein n=1 Tax=Sphaerisporangium corydalis TaxID=1441875 RepID=A0ABV9EQZ0_9ACTN|nr:bifunctional copper resistance protein CopD/cytochrome c oxidase assembly protein [Sphaerisporangium corydalis]